MLRVPMSAEALARSRFAVSPLSEAMDGLRALLDPAGTPHLLPWVSRVRADLRGCDRGLLRSLVPAPRGYVPDFLTPPPRSVDRTIEEDLADLAATPSARVEAELGLAHPGGLPAPLRAALAGGEEGFLRRVVEALRAYWAVAMAPDWPRVRAVLESDIALRGDLMARYGPAEALASLHPDIRWDGSALLVDRPHDVDVEWSEDEVLFSPSVFGGPVVYALVGTALPPVIYHPAQGAAGALRPRSRRGADADLFGATRAALLADLARPQSTGQLAAAHGLAPSTVSYHLGVLHRAGLVDRARQGRQVLYRRARRRS